MADFDVIIVGLGPTGLLLSHLLGRSGHRVLVLEQEATFYGNARAVHTDDECMRIFQSAQVADEVKGDMLADVPSQLVRTDGTVLFKYAPLERTFGWPPVNYFYQPHLETALSRLLSRYPNVEIRRNREVTDLFQDESGVAVMHRTTGDEKAQPEMLRAHYVVGADGGRSTVRAKLNIDMIGKNYPEPWLVVDLERNRPGCGLQHLPYFYFVLDPNLPTVSCVQPGGFHRFEFRLKPHQSKAEVEQMENVKMLLSRWIDLEQFTIKRKRVYTFNALVARHWRDRRILLAGDAAHMMPHFMGQGASSGIRDAANLAWKLDLVLRSAASPDLLDSYESERRSHAKAMIDVSVGVKNVVSMSNPILIKGRDLIMRLITLTPGLSSWFRDGRFKPDPTYDNGSYFGKRRRFWRGVEGKLSPQPMVRTLSGSELLFDHLTGPGFALVGLSCDPRAGLSTEARRTLDGLRTTYVELFPNGGRPNGAKAASRDPIPGLEEAEDIHGTMVKWFRRAGYRSHAVAILRPDKFVYAMSSLKRLDQEVRGLGARLHGRTI